MDPLILSSYVEGGQMPYGMALKQVERRRLYESLIEEYFATDNARPGILKSWLLGQRVNDDRAAQAERLGLHH